ncbi:hypothetical protein V1514DRAFT_329027 [Lipomyces japonicus]|uniref:uncharacterized protein n=1 Tax=Lipomyces japonicus TaxID=56871 RepID=UPI0034CFC7FE
MSSKPQIQGEEGRGTKLKASGTRVSSGAFVQMGQAQITRVKESFTMLDNDRDGVVSVADLEAMLTSLGQNPSSKTVDDMISRMASPLQFPVYLTEMSSLLSQFSTREELINAFSTFDDDDNGHANFDELSEALADVGINMEAINKYLQPYIRSSRGKEYLAYKEFTEGIIV